MGNAECGIQNAECGMRSAKLKFRIPKSEFRNSKGITFIELIIVMVIVGILSAIVIPRLDVTFTTSRSSVERAAYMIASD
ncbi:MAG: type IV pilin protein, partial [Thermodesulfovibrionales bacterium]